MMKRNTILIISFFVLFTTQILTAQERQIIIINLKNGYTVKGEIIEQTSQIIKIRSIDGDIIEYNSDQIKNTELESASSSKPFFKLNKDVPKLLSRGDAFISLGIGFFNLLPSDYLTTNKLLIPPIPLSLEFIIKDDLFNGIGTLGVGGTIGYVSSTSTGDLFEVKKSRFILGVKGFLHFSFIENFDTYVGTTLGYKNDKTNIKYGESPDEIYSKWDPTINIFAGCRYYFSEKISGMAEIGWGISIITLGVAIRLK